MALADDLDTRHEPAKPRRNVAVERVIVSTSSETINGKRVTVQRRRMPFAISNG